MNSTRKACIAIITLACFPLAAHADVVANFTDGFGAASADQYTGIAGGAWVTAWGALSGDTSPTTVSVANTAPINGSDNYLSLTFDNTGDRVTGRTFISDGTNGGVMLADPMTFSFDYRVDTLIGWGEISDYLTVQAGSATYGAGSTSTYIIRAYATAVGSANANEWAFYNGLGDGGSFSATRFVNSGMTITPGATYRFTITNYPATRQYIARISDGTTTVTSPVMGWRGTVASKTIGFNGKVSNSTLIPVDASTVSVDNIHIKSAAVAGDYESWAISNLLAGGPKDDEDGDGINNLAEYAFGLLPNSASSASPITLPFNKALGTLSFRRRDPALTLQTCSVWTSSDLVTWTEDTGAALIPGALDIDNFQQVEVTLTPSLLAAPTLFVQVRAQSN